MEVQLYPFAWIILRIVYAGLFLFAAVNLIKGWSKTVEAARLFCKSYTELFTMAAIAGMIVSGVFILFGIYARLGGIYLIFFNLGGAYIHYQLVKQALSLKEEANQKLVELAVLGNATSAQKNFVLAAVAFFFMIQGSGPWSVVSF